jgi:hypothetical protein
MNDREAVAGEVHRAAQTEAQWVVCNGRIEQSH